MSFCVPLKTVLELDKSLVGRKAIPFAVVEYTNEIPFSMVITTNTFDEFVKYNQLSPELEWFRKAHTSKEKVESFSRLSTAMKNAQFPDYVLSSLQECFELVSLDTNNLHNLSTKNQSKGLLSLHRSTSFDDSNNVVNGTILTKETFKQFLESIKKTYISSFTPSAYLDNDPKVAIIVSRVPKIKATVEATLDVKQNSLFIKSYLGFPDPMGHVEKDEFKINLDFLKINKSSIVSQNTVVVFNSASNNMAVKEFSSNTSSQSLSDTTILECARLTKQIAKATKADMINAQFFANDEKIICTDLDIDFSSGLPELKEEVTSPNSETEIQGLSKPPQEIEAPTIEQNITPDAVPNVPASSNETITFDTQSETNVPFPVLKEENNYNDITTKNMITTICDFLEKFNTKDIGASVEILKRSLENPTKESLNQALELCKVILNTW